jgi:hypothetical protein
MYRIGLIESSEIIKDKKANDSRTQLKLVIDPLLLLDVRCHREAVKVKSMIVPVPSLARRLDASTTTI